MKDKETKLVKKKKNEIDMINGPILKKMLLFTFPIMLSSILQILFNAADVIIVGRWAGDASLAAVGATTSLINLLTNMFIGLSIGANVLVAKFFGARKYDQLNDAVHTSVTLSLISGALLAVIGIVLAAPLLTLMQTPTTVLKLAVIYLRIYFLGMPAMMLYNFGSAILRAKGDTKRPLYFLTVAGIVNVVLNLLFVIKLDMNVAGVAAATAIAQYLSAGAVLVCLMREEEESGLKLHLKKLTVHKEQFKTIMQVGLPAGLQGTLFSVSNVIIQASINSFGDVVVAGNAAAGNIENFVYFAMNAFYQAAISFTSQNVGAHKYERVGSICIKSVTCATITGLVLGVLAFTFGETLLGIYTTSDAVIDAGMRRLAIVCTTYAICGIMDTMVGVLRGLGYSVMPMIVSLVGACGLRLVWIATFFQTETFHTPDGIYLSYPVTWAITAATHIVCFVIVYRKIMERERRMAAGEVYQDIVGPSVKLPKFIKRILRKLRRR